VIKFLEKVDSSRFGMKRVDNILVEQNIFSEFFKNKEKITKIVLVAFAVIFGVIASLTFYFNLPIAVWITFTVLSIGFLLIGGSLAISAIVANVKSTKAKIKKNEVSLLNEKETFLPNELWLEIFLYCSGDIVIEKLQLTSKKFYEIINTDTSGKAFFKRDYPKKIKELKQKIQSSYFSHYRQYYNYRNFFQLALYFLKDTDIRITFWGKIIIQEKSGNKYIELNNFGEKILDKVIEKKKKKELSLKERVIGMKIINILQNYYEISDQKIINSHFLTLISACIRKILDYTREFRSFPYNNTTRFCITTEGEWAFTSYTQEDFNKIPEKYQKMDEWSSDPLSRFSVSKDSLKLWFLKKNGIKTEDSDIKEGDFDFKNLE
jgi:hypothetical protein